MNQENVSFSRFGKDFQEKLAQLILQDRVFCDQIHEVLDINFLELKYLQVFVERIFSYKQQYETHPSYVTMATILRSDIDAENEAVKQQIRSYFARIYKRDMEVDGEEYIKNISLDFCRKQKLKEAMIKSANLLQKSSFEEISTIINDALRLGCDNNFGHDYIQDFEERFELKTRNPVTTGWGEIDKICRDGLGRGELGVVIAPTGAGKSMALVHLGSAAIRSGRMVVHYTLELQDTTIGTRYDSCLTGIPLQEVFGKKDEIYENIKDLDGKLVIKEYPTKSASTGTIKTHLEKLRNRGHDIGMVIVDYADLLRPKVNNKEKRMELESIYEELRGIAQESECPIWTASQTNRSGLNAEVITMESISEAFNKCFVSDFIFSVSRTAEDKITNSGRIFVAKNRNGPDGLVFPIYMDTSRVKMDVFEQSSETVDSIMRKSTKEQAKTLREKYKEFKGVNS